MEFLYASSKMVFGEGGNNLLFVNYCGDKEKGYTMVVSTDTKTDKITIVLSDSTEFTKENIKKVMKKITPELVENVSRNFGIKNILLYEYQTLINDMLEPLLPKKRTRK